MVAAGDEEIACDYVISNASPIAVYNHLMNPVQVPEEALVEMKSRNLSSSAFTMFIGFDCEPDQLGITGSYDNNSGVLTLTGTASVADYQTALRSVQYADADSSPTLGTLYAHFSGDDGTDDSNVADRRIELINGELAESRERYQALVAHPDRIEEILVAGAAKARAFATPYLARIREAVGIRALG